MPDAHTIQLAGVEVSQLPTGAHRWLCEAHGEAVTAFLKANGRWAISAACKRCDQAALQPVLDAIVAARAGTCGPDGVPTAQSNGLEADVPRNGRGDESARATSRQPPTSSFSSSNEEIEEPKQASKKEKAPSGGDDGAGVRTRRDVGNAALNDSHNAARNGRAQEGNEDFLRRVPPNDPDAEMSVLGAVLIENEAIGKIPWLTVEMFYRESHRHIYRAMLGLRANAQPIDAVTLSRALKTADKFEQIGGMDYIAEVVQKVPAASNIEHYAAITRDMNIKREVAERATALVSLAYNGVTADALLGEMERTLKFDTEVSALPSLEKTTVEVLSWHQMQERRAARTRDWAVEGWLALRETSSWSGKVEGGKTTLMRELTMAVLRGQPFLGRPTVKGRVFYAMLDADGEDVTYEEFEKLGFDNEDDRNCEFVFEPMLAQIRNGLEQFVEKLLAFRPTLVIIDPYPRLKMIEDFHSYTNTYLMGMLSDLARRCNAHFALPGHIPRGRGDDDDVATAGFGSISFSGGVNARFVVTNRNGIHTIRTSRGKAAGFEPLEGERVLRMDEYSHRISLGDPFSWKDKGIAVKAKIGDFLADNTTRPFDLPTLAREMQIQRSIVRTALSMLHGEQKIKRSGEGLKTKPYIYAALAYTGEMTLEEVKRE